MIYSYELRQWMNHRCNDKQKQFVIMTKKTRDISLNRILIIIVDNYLNNDCGFI